VTLEELLPELLEEELPRELVAPLKRSRKKLPAFLLELSRDVLLFVPSTLIGMLLPYLLPMLALGFV